MPNESSEHEADEETVKVLQRLKAAHDEVHRLCEPGSYWRMTIPVDQRRDSDVILSDALNDAEHEIERLTRERDEARATVAWFERAFPCDAGCVEAPEEECSRHGRRPGELWVAIGQIQDRYDETRAAMARISQMEHRYGGDCPDPSQPDSRDPLCPACLALIALSGGAGEQDKAEEDFHDLVFEAHPKSVKRYRATLTPTEEPTDDRS